MGVERRRQSLNRTRSGAGLALLDGLGLGPPLHQVPARRLRGAGKGSRRVGPSGGLLPARKGGGVGEEQGRRQPRTSLPRQLRPQPGLTRGSLGAARGEPPASSPPSGFQRAASASRRLLPPPLSPGRSGAELGETSVGSSSGSGRRTSPGRLPLTMDSRYTSTAGIGDLNQLSAAIPATRVEVSVSCR